MAKQTFGLKGTPNTNYDLDELEQDNRLNSKRSLVVQVWKYNPNSLNEKKKSPNPPDLQLGQIWLSRRVDSDDKSSGDK